MQRCLGGEDGWEKELGDFLILVNITITLCNPKSSSLQSVETPFSNRSTACGVYSFGSAPSKHPRRGSDRNYLPSPSKTSGRSPHIYRTPPPARRACHGERPVLNGHDTDHQQFARMEIKKRRNMEINRIGKEKKDIHYF